jgi:hypothetical protein
MGPGKDVVVTGGTEVGRIHPEKTSVVFPMGVVTGSAAPRCSRPMNIFHLHPFVLMAQGADLVVRFDRGKLPLFVARFMT